MSDWPIIKSWDTNILLKKRRPASRRKRIHISLGMTISERPIFIEMLGLIGNIQSDRGVLCGNLILQKGKSNKTVFYIVWISRRDFPLLTVCFGKNDDFRAIACKHNHED